MRNAALDQISAYGGYKMRCTFSIIYEDVGVKAIMSS